MTPDQYQHYMGFAVAVWIAAALGLLVLRNEVRFLKDDDQDYGIAIDMFRLCLVVLSITTIAIVGLHRSFTP